MNRFARLLALSLTVGMTAATNAAILDDFNRPDSTNLGPDWSEAFGDTEIVGNAVSSPVPFATQGIMHTSFMSGSPDMTADVSISGPQSPAFIGGNVALVVRAASSDSDFDNGAALYVKIQDNNADGTFDTVLFNTGTDGSQLSTIGSPTVSVTPFTDATIRLSSVNNTVTFGIDRGSDGTYEDSITRMFIASFAASLGDRVGFGMNGDTVTLDNFAVIPEPATLALLGAGGLTLLRRRR